MGWLHLSNTEVYLMLLQNTDKLLNTEVYLMLLQNTDKLLNNVFTEMGLFTQQNLMFI